MECVSVFDSYFITYFNIDCCCKFFSFLFKVSWARKTNQNGFSCPALLVHDKLTRKNFKPVQGEYREICVKKKNKKKTNSEKLLS